MRRLAAILLCLRLVCPTVGAAPAVALTFDDGPSGRFTERLLDGLEQRQVKATFFLCGYRVAQYPALTARIAEQGHEIGLHGYSHNNMAQMGRGELERELNDTMALLPDNGDIHLLRPPGGRTTDQVAQAAAGRGIAIVTWSVDPKDWATGDAAAVTEAVMSRVHDGDIILLHDMTDSSVDAALAIIDQLRERGWSLCTVSELAERKGQQLQPGRCYRRLP